MCQPNCKVPTGHTFLKSRFFCPLGHSHVEAKWGKRKASAGREILTLPCGNRNVRRGDEKEGRTLQNMKDPRAAGGQGEEWSVFIPQEMRPGCVRSHSHWLRCLADTLALSPDFSESFYVVKKVLMVFSAVSPKRSRSG